MNFITQEQAKEAAKQGELEALECSLEHHEQGRDADWVELKEAIESGKFNVFGSFCACCHKHRVFVANCENCSLNSHLTSCADGEWYKVNQSFTVLKKDYSNANFKAFQEAEAELCKYIEGVIEKVKSKKRIEQDKCKKCEKPELRHGDYGDCGHDKWIKIYNDVYWIDVDRAVSGLNDRHFIPNRTGNLVDDLKRNGEDFKKKTIEIAHDDEVTIGLESLEGIALNSTTCLNHLTPDKAIELGQTLIHAATAKRKQS